MSGFSQAEAKDLPRLGCIGRVSAVGESREAKSGNYLVIPIEIEGYGASRSIRVHFIYRPEWLTPDFDYKALETLDGGESYSFVYCNNVLQDGNISLLQGLVGGEASGVARKKDATPVDLLAERLFALPVNAETGGPSGEAVAEVLTDVLVNEEAGALVGYVLKQQQQKTGVNPDTGKMTYANTPFYEVDQWFVPNDKGRARIKNRAEQAPKGSFFVQFTDEDIPS